MQYRLKTSSAFKEDEPLRATTKESMRDSVAKIPAQNLDKSNKKALKKTKTEKVEIDDKPKDNEPQQCGSSKKRKVNYNIKEDGSDGESDSEPSEDNLDADQILKLIPKKLGKKKYLKGVEEKKKKAILQTEVKVPKKPKTMLMPCMSQKKDKEVKSTRNASESAVKK